MNETEPLSSLFVPAATINTFQADRLRSFLPLVASTHPHYGPLLQGLDLSDPLSALERLPITTKRDLAAAPEKFVLDAGDGSPLDLWDVIYTSGSTGPPTPIYQTTYDFPRILHAQRRMAAIRGLTSRDRIANLFPLTERPNGSWIRVNDHSAAIGAPVVCGLGGANLGSFSPTRRLPDVVRTVVDADPTILWGIGSYIRRFLAAALEERRRLTSVRMVITSGEPMHDAIERSMLHSLSLLGSTSAVVSRGFGASELQCSLVACGLGSGLHNPAPELFLLQVVDDVGRTLPRGGKGRLVITHLDRRGTVLLRYDLGDIVTLDRRRCPACGRSGERLVAHHGRSDGSVKVRGQLVSLRVVSDAVAGDADVFEHAVTVERADSADPTGLDTLLVRIAIRPGADPESTAARIRDTVGAICAVTPRVDIVDPDDVYDPDQAMKPTRISGDR